MPTCHAYHISSIVSESSPPFPHLFRFSPARFLSLPLDLRYHLPLKLTLPLCLLPVHPRNLEPPAARPVRDAPEPRHRPEHRRIDHGPLLVRRVLPDPEPLTPDENRGPRFRPGSGNAIPLAPVDERALDAKDGLLDACGLDRRAGRGVQARDGPLGGPEWGI